MEYYKYKTVIRYRLKKMIKKLLGEEFSKKLDKDYSKYFSRYPFLIDRLYELMSEFKYPRPQYIWGVLSAADLARNLNIQRFSVIEFGVAGGKGLMALEAIADQVEKLYNISIDVYGFDSGHGLPKPADHRDLPNLWGEGYFPMDRKALEQNLTRSKLYLGLVKDTINDFIATQPAPVGFIVFDLDLYSSTIDAFSLFQSGIKNFLPRVHCYFDDVWGWTYGDCNGELLAISEFNQKNKAIKISKINGLRYLINVHNAYWPDQIYLAHFFDHELYSQNDGLLQVSQI